MFEEMGRLPGQGRPVILNSQSLSVSYTLLIHRVNKCIFHESLCMICKVADAKLQIIMLHFGPLVVILAQFDYEAFRGLLLTGIQ